MAEILNFGDGKGNVTKADVPSKEKTLAAFVWSCAQCGNTTFQLEQGGSVRCAHCQLRSIDVAHFDPKEKP